MRELTAIEIENVSGAGWLADSFATWGGNLSDKLWPSSNGLSIEMPLIGTVNFADYAPNLLKNIGTLVGAAVGGAIETSLASVPVIGAVFKKLLGN